MNRGSCLCRSIRFTIDGELRAARYCHCGNCAKFAGTTPVAWAMAEKSSITVDRSQRTISKFNSGKGLRCFCSGCGSPLWFESLDHPETVAIPLGVLDEGAVPAPEMHIWVRSRPDWCVMNDDLPQHDTNPQARR